MKLDELKKMISEEFESYMREDEDQLDVSVGDADVDMDADMDMEPGMGEEQNPEDALEQIYQMLKAYFEEDGEDNDMDGEVDEPGEDIEEADLEENATTDAKFQKTGMAPASKGSAGPNAGYGAVGGKGSTGYDAGSKALQERFQKLANIKTLKG